MDRKEQPCYIGMDIGGTKTLMMVQQGEKIIFEKRVNSTGRIPLIRNMIVQCVEAANGAPIGGLAIGVPARVNCLNGWVIDAPGLHWHGLSLREELFSEFDFPCVVENDAKMALYGECSLGAARKSDNVIFITIGTGLGSAIKIGGKMIDGANFSAGEIGYCVFDVNQIHDCNNSEKHFGVLERQVSGSALNKEAGKLGMTACEMLHSENEAARKRTREFLKMLALTIANLTSILNPEYVILGGGVSESLEEHLDYIRAQVAALTPIPTRVTISEFKNRAGALGACCRARLLNVWPEFAGNASLPVR